MGKPITDKQLKALTHLKRIGFAKKPVSTIFKYMPASRVLEILEKSPHQICFVSPSKWKDPYEAKYLETNYRSLGGFVQPRIFCFCASSRLHNEEASWEMYKKANDPLIRLSIRTIDFLSALNKYAADHNYGLYLSKVCYKLKRSDINNLYLPNNKHHDEYFGNFDEKQYIKVMSLKRRAFEYENEYRFFIIPRGANIEDKVLHIPFPIKAITGFTLYPHKKGDGFLSQIETARYAAEYELISKRISAAYPNSEVSVSTLYDNADSVEKVEM